MSADSSHEETLEANCQAPDKFYRHLGNTTKGCVPLAPDGETSLGRRGQDITVALVLPVGGLQLSISR